MDAPAACGIPPLTDHKGCIDSMLILKSKVLLSLWHFGLITPCLLCFPTSCHFILVSDKTKWLSHWGLYMVSTYLYVLKFQHSRSYVEKVTSAKLIKTVCHLMLAIYQMYSIFQLFMDMHAKICLPSKSYVKPAQDISPQYSATDSNELHVWNWGDTHIEVTWHWFDTFMVVSKWM